MLLLAGGVIAVLKGLRLPSGWPATQAQIDYRNGFLRRGLLGEVCRQLHIPIWRYSIFAALSFVLLAAFLLLVAWCVRRSGLDALALGAFSALLAGSFCVSMLVSLVGYHDVLLVILVLLVLLIPDPRWQLIGAAVAGVTGVLVHELYAVAFLPVSLSGAVMWASEQRAGSHAPNWARWSAVAGVALLPWVLVFAIAGHPGMTATQLTALQTAIASRVDFEPRAAMLDVLTRSGHQNLQMMLQYVRFADAWVEEAFAMLAFLPTSCFFLAIAFRLAEGRSLAVKVWLMVSTFSPLLLDFQGLDYYRWAMMMSWNACFCAIASSFTCRRRAATKSSGMALQNQPIYTFGIEWRNAAVFLLAINLATSVGFFGAPGKTFPFREYALHFHAARKAHRPLMQPESLFPKRIDHP